MTNDELDQLVDDIEKQKARVRIEEDDLRNDYHNGQWRKHGLTKKDCELRISRLKGEIAGLESALTFLYKAQSKRGLS